MASAKSKGPKGPPKGRVHLEFDENNKPIVRRLEGDLGDDTKAYVQELLGWSAPGGGMESPGTAEARRGVGDRSSQIMAQSPPYLKQDAGESDQPQDIEGLTRLVQAQVAGGPARQVQPLGPYPQVRNSGMHVSPPGESEPMLQALERLQFQQNPSDVEQEITVEDLRRLDAMKKDIQDAIARHDHATLRGLTEDYQRLRAKLLAKQPPPMSQETLQGDQANEVKRQELATMEAQQALEAQQAEQPPAPPVAAGPEAEPGMEDPNAMAMPPGDPNAMGEAAPEPGMEDPNAMAMPPEDPMGEAAPIEEALPEEPAMPDAGAVPPEDPNAMAAPEPPPVDDGMGGDMGAGDDAGGAPMDMGGADDAGGGDDLGGDEGGDDMGDLDAMFGGDEGGDEGAPGDEGGDMGGEGGDEGGGDDEEPPPVLGESPKVPAGQEIAPMKPLVMPPTQLSTPTPQEAPSTVENSPVADEGEDDDEGDGGRDLWDNAQALFDNPAMEKIIAEQMGDEVIDSGSDEDEQPGFNKSQEDEKFAQLIAALRTGDKDVANDILSNFTKSMGDIFDLAKASVMGVKRGRNFKTAGHKPSKRGMGAPRPNHKYVRRWLQDGEWHYEYTKEKDEKNHGVGKNAVEASSRGESHTIEIHPDLLNADGEMSLRDAYDAYKQTIKTHKKKSPDALTWEDSSDGGKSFFRQMIGTQGREVQVSHGPAAPGKKQKWKPTTLSMFVDHTLKKNHAKTYLDRHGNKPLFSVLERKKSDGMEWIVIPHGRSSSNDLIQGKMLFRSKISVEKATRFLAAWHEVKEAGIVQDWSGKNTALKMKPFEGTVGRDHMKDTDLPEGSPVRSLELGNLSYIAKTDFDDKGREIRILAPAMTNKDVKALWADPHLIDVLAASVHRAVSAALKTKAKPSDELYKGLIREAQNHVFHVLTIQRDPSRRGSFSSGFIPGAGHFLGLLSESLASRRNGTGVLYDYIKDEFRSDHSGLEVVENRAHGDDSDHDNFSSNREEDNIIDQLDGVEDDDGDSGGYIDAMDVIGDLDSLDQMRDEEFNSYNDYDSDPDDWYKSLRDNAAFALIRPEMAPYVANMMEPILKGFSDAWRSSQQGGAVEHLEAQLSKLNKSCDETRALGGDVGDLPSSIAYRRAFDWLKSRKINKILQEVIFDCVEPSDEWCPIKVACMMLLGVSALSPELPTVSPGEALTQMVEAVQKYSLLTSWDASPISARQAKELVEMWCLELEENSIFRCASLLVDANSTNLQSVKVEVLAEVQDWLLGEQS